VYIVHRAAEQSGTSNTQHASAHLGSEVVQLEAESQRIAAVDPAAAAREIIKSEATAAAVAPPTEVAAEEPESPEETEVTVDEPATEEAPPATESPAETAAVVSNTVATTTDEERPLSPRAVQTLNTAFMATFAASLATSLYVLFNLLR
jgi:hypothetical protein